VSIASVMKRIQNKIPLNFIVPSNKKWCKIVKEVSTVNNRPESLQSSSINWDTDNVQE